MTVWSAPLESAHACWLIPAPAGDETLRSVLHRAADFHELPPETLWESLCDGAGVPAEDVDGPPATVVERMATILEVTVPRLQRLTLDGGEGWLAAGPRHAYCPSCWRDDDAVGRPRHFRRAWARVLALNCIRHGKPLMLWHPVRRQYAPRAGDDISLAEFMAGTVGAKPALRTAVGAIHNFAFQLERCLSHGAYWPRGWQADAMEARRLLVHVMEADSTTGGMLLSQAYTSTALRPFVHAGPNASEAGAAKGWERLRRTQDPATRRMALWLVGSWLVPTWPSDFQAPLPRP